MSVGKTIIFLLFLLPLALLAQEEGEIEFNIKKTAPEKVYLLPNFDTIVISADTLVSGERYYFTLVGIDSASIVKVDFGSGSCKIKAADGSKTILDMIPVSYIKGTSTASGMPLEVPLAIYRKTGSAQNELCFSTVFVVVKRLYNPPPGRMRWRRVGYLSRWR